MRLTHSNAGRARRGLGMVALAVAALAATACDTQSLLEVTDPDIINPSDVTTLQGANALRLGAIARLNAATTGGESTFLLGGLLADEYRSADTFLQRNETDRRAVQTNNAQVTTAFRTLYRARLSAEQAVAALEQFEAPAWQVGQMYLVQAYVANQLAEDFCGHIPFSTVVEGREELGNALTTVETFEQALEWVDAAITAASAAGGPAAATEVLNAARVLKGRILLNLGRPAEAAQAVAEVPTTFAWELEHSDNTNLNATWSLNNSIGRWYVSQGEGENGLDFVTPDDPRVPTCDLPDKSDCNSDTPVSAPFDPATPVVGGATLIIQQKWPTRYDPVAIASGIEARLIEAEAALDAGNNALALTKLNGLRSGAGISGLTALSSVNADVLFRERAFWLFGTGHRLGDLRRLIRDYGRSADDVFPVGTWWKGGEYGADVNFPVPQAEENNPNFSRASCVTTQA